ncbi:glycosyltransferase [Maritalea porphyrae]
MTTNSSTRRLFLVDHMCVLPFGHNLNAMVLFERELGRFFEGTMCLACSALPDYAEQANQVRRELSFPYDGVLERAAATKRSDGVAVNKTQLGIRPLLNNRLVRKALYTASFEFLGIDIVSGRTLSDWKSIFRRHKISRADAIFFPSAEFYGCVTLLELLGQLPETERPSVHFRFIGVGENVKYSFSQARPIFLDAIRRAKLNGTRLSVSAETPRYVEYLRNILDIDVLFVPYPLASESASIPWRQNKTIASPGQGRADKGFFRLNSIIGEIAEHYPEVRFEYDVQNMRTRDRDYRSRYESGLARIPRMNLRPERLSQDEINSVYEKSDIMLLPYDAETYAMRGSAVYQETLAVGRPVVCSRDLGFSDLVVRYGNGLLAESDTEFADALVELSSWDKKKVEKACRDARNLFERDVESAFTQVAEILQS